MQTTFRSFSTTEKVSFPKQEEEILELWEKIKAFENQLELSKDKPPFTFYDGPPFATGLPHYGHILAGTIKDVVTRYQTQNGHFVERRFGWDCHGVPIEFEIEKTLHISGREDVMKMGIANYNKECRGIVQKYTKEWETTVKRCGRWIDFENNYKTMDLSFMESVWWVFKTLHEKGLVYRGYRVMPCSTALGTPLSNFEAKQNVKEDQVDPAIVVTFPVIGDPDGAEFLAWTTTPWTLPSNLALCVNSDFDYLKVRDTATERVYYIGEKRLEEMYPPKKKSKKKKKSKGDEGPPYKVLKKVKGKELVGLRYEPLFNYFADRAGTDCKHKPNFVVICDDYVTDDAGTGIVHQAPGFGEDDFRVCLREGLITKTEIPCPVNPDGTYQGVISDWAGIHVKKADNAIIKTLRERGRLVKKSDITHAYPMCWRSDSPLLYMTVPAWFVEVTKIKKELVECNHQTYWVPEFVKTKRFHNWLEDARDWCVSRARYWGTPLPIWVSDDFEEVVVVGSVEELYQLSGVRVSDLHRENIDDVVIKSRKGKGDLRRVDEVFDCWFESGSMPYAQQHYPFEDEQAFQSKFPADFIAEGLDQTRGWFYTLMVLSTGLFGKPAFKNLVVNGLVLAKDGKKMSKSKKNYPDPAIILNDYGADALRVYLMNSPVVRAEPLRFDKEGVFDVVKSIFMPWWNSYKLFIECSCHYEQKVGKFVYDPEKLKDLELNLMDRYILSRLQTLTKYFRQEMDAYRLYNVIPNMLNFVDELSTQYVRFNKDVLKGYEDDESAQAGLAVLYHVLLNTCQIMAPFTPFLVEAMYQNLKNALVDPMDSVHYLPIPQVDPSHVNESIEKGVTNLNTVLNLARRARDNVRITNRYPLESAIVICPDKSFTDSLQVGNISDYIKTDANLRNLRFSNKMEEWINLTCEPNNRSLGQRLKRKAGEVKKAMLELDQPSLLRLRDEGSLEVCGEKITLDDCTINFCFGGDTTKFECCSGKSEDGQSVLVVVDKVQTPVLLRAGLSREITSSVQKLRKACNLVSTDLVWVYYKADGADVQKAIDENISDMVGRLRCPFEPVSSKPAYTLQIGNFEKDLEGGRVTVYMVQPCARLTKQGYAKAGKSAEDLDKYVQSKSLSSMKAQTESGFTLMEVNGEKFSFTADDLMFGPGL